MNDPTYNNLVYPSPKKYRIQKKGIHTTLHQTPLSLLVNSIGGLANKLSFTGLELIP
jgi:hypothetical protein